MLNRHLPLRIAVLSSHRSPGLLDLLDDPEHGRLFDIVALISSEEQIAEAAEVERRDVSVIHHAIQPFMDERGYDHLDLRHRHVYDQKTDAMLRILSPDLILLSDYRYVLTPAILTNWANQILSVHDSDLTNRAKDGLPRYRGLGATREAIFAGEAETRASVHIVNENLVGGPVVLRSEPFPVSPLAAEALAWGDDTILRAYAHAHRSWVLQSTYGPLLRRAIEIWSSFEVLIINGRIYVDGYETPLPDVSCLGARTRRPALSLVSS